MPKLFHKIEVKEINYVAYQFFCPLCNCMHTIGEDNGHRIKRMNTSRPDIDMCMDIGKEEGNKCYCDLNINDGVISYLDHEYGYAGYYQEDNLEFKMVRLTREGKRDRRYPIKQVGGKPVNLKKIWAKLKTL